MLGDMRVGVHETVVILYRSQVSLERSKDTHIQWLELIGGMRRESDNDDAILNRILNSLNIHVRYSIVDYNKDLIVRRTISPFLHML